MTRANGPRILSNPSLNATNVLIINVNLYIYYIARLAHIIVTHQQQPNTKYNNNHKKLLRIDNQQLEISQKIERTNDLLSSNATASF